MRIASLLASATEIVCALDLEEHLVAISHECDYPAHIVDRPRVSRPRFDPAELDSGGIDAAVRDTMAAHGAVYALDETTLRAVAPDLVLTQDVCEVCAVPTSLAHQAARALGGTPTVLSLDAHSVDGILESIAQVGRAAGAAARADHVVAQYRDRLTAVESRVRAAPRPRVLALEWLDPVFVPGHWVPEMIERAGGTNLVGSPGGRSQELTWAALGGLDPDVLLVMPCGYGLRRSWEDAEAQAPRLMTLAPRAIDGGRAFVLDGSSYFNRSGPRVVDGVELLARLLHPTRFDERDLSDRAAPWRPGLGQSTASADPTARDVSTFGRSS